jgi:hypothetical protein
MLKPVQEYVLTAQMPGQHVNQKIVVKQLPSYGDRLTIEFFEEIECDGKPIYRSSYTMFMKSFANAIKWARHKRVSSIHCQENLNVV